jgi:chloramphenicol O-acetyltransferase type A
MRQIDMENWPRREQFEVFNSFDYPHFSLSVNVDLTTFYQFVKQSGISFNVATVYTVARAANAIPEFRQRIRMEKVIEHEIVHPSSTIMGKDDIFSFCSMEYFQDFPEFASRAAEKIARVKERPRLLEEDKERDDLLFMTSIPWVSFTSFMHPLHLHPVDSVPRFAWGKFFDEGDLVNMPLSVQGHHAIMDGLHAARFYSEVQGYFQHPDLVLG